MDEQTFNEAVNVRGLDEGHLDIDLRKLRLAVGAEVLVPETAHDLKVALHTRDHQELLEDLRRLRKRVERALVHATRHEIVARPLGRRLRQKRRLDLVEALAGQIFAGGKAKLAAFFEIAPHRSAS